MILLDCFIQRFIMFCDFIFNSVSVSKPYISVSDVNPLEGSNIWMRCNVENGTRPIQYVWQYETQDGEITVFPQFNISMVNMSNVNRDHTGWYRCVATNAVNRERSDRIWLNVVYGPELPRIVMTPSTMTRSGYSALEEQSVSLLCEAQSNPASQYIWFFNNSQVYAGPELTITSVQRMQTGDYACLAQNTFLNTRSKKTISLIVYCESDL
uniref:Ig-like domain-containing protein n=1 Tax=Sphaeramia orbicularis TaxID=375764 RepID=A0A672ZSM1_9TELE